MKKLILLLCLLCLPAQSNTREIYGPGSVIIGACSIVVRKEAIIEYCSATEGDSVYNIITFRGEGYRDLGKGFSIRDIKTGASVHLEFDEIGQAPIRIAGRMWSSYYWEVRQVFLNIFSKGFNAEFILYDNGTPFVVKLTDEERQEFTFISGFE